MISEFFSGLLHEGAQALLVPTMVCLVLLVAIMIFCVASIIVEGVTARARFKADHIELISQLRDADYREIPQVIAKSELLDWQACALLRIALNMGLSDDELFALSSVELDRCDGPCRRRLNLTELLAKIGPMLGLMGTLIPLGPGIVAMGQGDVETLSNSLRIAFDTTIAGLAAAIVALIVSRLRRTWYGQYSTMMQALASCILDEASRAREEGVKLPYGPTGDMIECLERLRALPYGAPIDDVLADAYFAADPEWEGDAR